MQLQLSSFPDFLHFKSSISMSFKWKNQVPKSHATFKRKFEKLWTTSLHPYKPETVWPSQICALYESAIAPSPDLSLTEIFSFYSTLTNQVIGAISSLLIAKASGAPALRGTLIILRKCRVGETYWWHKSPILRLR